MNSLKFKILFFAILLISLSSCGGKKVDLDLNQKIWKSLTYNGTSCVGCSEFQTNESTFTFRFKQQDMNNCTQLFDVIVSDIIDTEIDMVSPIKINPVANCFNLQQNDEIQLNRFGSKIEVRFIKAGQLDIFIEYI